MLDSDANAWALEADMQFQQQMIVRRADKREKRLSVERELVAAVEQTFQAVSESATVVRSFAEFTIAEKVEKAPFAVSETF